MKGFKKMETGIMIFKIREASGTGTLAILPSRWLTNQHIMTLRLCTAIPLQ